MKINQVVKTLWLHMSIFRVSQLSDLFCSCLFLLALQPNNVLVPFVSDEHCRNGWNSFYKCVWSFKSLWQFLDWMFSNKKVLKVVFFFFFNYHYFDFYITTGIGWLWCNPLTKYLPSPVQTLSEKTECLLPLLLLLFGVNNSFVIHTYTGIIPLG